MKCRIPVLLIAASAILAVTPAAKGQMISGTVSDIETGKPVSYAAVYFDGTSVAAYSDDKGFFRLDIKNIGSMSLVVSALGYNTVRINNHSPGRDIKVQLTPKPIEMDEVNITARGNPRQRMNNLEIFRREFLGRTANAFRCEIENENDIRFITSPDRDTLRAFSLNPVIIRNKGLGYRITYYLIGFEYINSEYRHQLIGTSIFEDEISGRPDEEYYRQRRDSSYYGSKMHFLRSLWQNSLQSSGYSIKKSDRNLSYFDLVKTRLNTDPGKNMRYIFLSETLPATLILRWEPANAESSLELTRNNIFFDKNGYYQGPGIVWYGEMAKQGMADLLPYDYLPSDHLPDSSGQVMP